MIRKGLTLPTVCLGLLAISTLRSQADFTIGDWIGTSSQTVGDTTWVLTATTLPAGLGVNFLDQAYLRVQNTTCLLLGPASYSLDYIVSIASSKRFALVAIDTTTAAGSSTLTKLINGGLTV